MLGSVVIAVSASGLRSLATYAVPTFTKLSNLVHTISLQPSDKPASTPAAMHVHSLQQYRHGSTSLSGSAALAAAGRSFRHALHARPAASAASVLQTVRQGPATASYSTQARNSRGTYCVAALHRNSSRRRPGQGSALRELPLEPVTGQRVTAAYLEEQAIREAIQVITSIRCSKILPLVKNGTLVTGYQDIERFTKLNDLGGGVYVIWVSLPGSSKRTAHYLGKANCFCARIQDYVFPDKGWFALDEDGYKHYVCQELQRGGFDIEIELFPTGDYPPEVVEARLLWQFDFALNNQLNGSVKAVLVNIVGSRYQLVCVPADYYDQELSLPADQVIQQSVIDQQEQESQVGQDQRSGMSRQCAVVAANFASGGVVLTCTAEEAVATEQADVNLCKPLSTGAQVADAVMHLGREMQAAKDLSLVIMQALILKKLQDMTGCKAGTPKHLCQEALWEQLYNQAVARLGREQAGSNGSCSRSVTVAAGMLQEMLKYYDDLLNQHKIGTKSVEDVKPNLATPDSDQLETVMQEVLDLLAGSTQAGKRPSLPAMTVRRAARLLKWVSDRKHLKKKADVQQLEERLVKLCKQQAEQNLVAAGFAVA